MSWRKFAGGAGWMKLGLAVVVALAVRVAQAQPANDNFANATAIYGYTGSTTGANTGATLQPGEPTSITLDDLAGVTNSVWFAWTAPAGGTVTFDTIGSSFDTVLAVYTATNGLSVSNLALIAANDDINYPVQTNSQVSFMATNGATYYIAVDGNSDTYSLLGSGASGGYTLNWNLPTAPTSPGTIVSGAFLWTAPTYTAADVDSSVRLTVTRAAGSSGRVMVDYAVSNMTYVNTFTTNYFGTNVFVTITDTNAGTITTNNTYLTNIVYSDSYQEYAGGYQNYVITGGYTNYVTIENGLTNRTTGSITNLNYPQGTYNNSTTVTINTATGTIATNTVTFSYHFTTNRPVASAVDITPNATGTLTFDDFQMSQDITLPINNSANNNPNGSGVPKVPGLVTAVLSNPRLDPLESSDLNPPTVDPVLGTALVNELSTQIGSVSNGATIFNLSASVVRVNETIQPPTVTLRVTRSGGVPADAVAVDYQFDGQNQNGNTFTLRAGSDYATPNQDFSGTNGTLTWAANDMTPKTITLTITNDSLVEFNEDIDVALNNPRVTTAAATPDPGAEIGQLNRATVTILFEDQPAGAADRNWNSGGLGHPGADGGIVYAVAEQPNGYPIIAGSFTSYDQKPYNRIARLTSSGQPDTSFLVSPNSGANDFISALALQPDGRILVGGNFTAFNGNNRHRIARLNSDGSLDSSFNPGLGADGPIWAMVLVSTATQETNLLDTGLGYFETNVVVVTNAQVMIAGDFTSVNGIALNHIARLNLADGSVDTTFNPGVGPDGTVNALAVDALGRIIIGGDFDQVSGVLSGGVARLNTDGTVDSTFNPGVGTYNLDTGNTDPVNALLVQPDGRIVIAGGFSWLDLVSYNGIARLNPDGTVDTTFGQGSGTYNPLTGDTDPIYSMMAQPDGNILIGGYFTAYNQTRRMGVARLFGTDGTLDTSFMDTAYNQFAGLINHYHNPSAVSTNLYPSLNTRNYVTALAQEAWTTNYVTTTNVVQNPNGTFTTNTTTTANVTQGNDIIGGSFLYLGGGSTRDATLPRSNVARLIGDSTPGPGNVQFTTTGNNTVAKNVGGPGFPIQVGRVNGNLGIISASFTTNTAAPGPGIAIPDVSFSLNPSYRAITWNTLWSGAWMYSDGSSGNDTAYITIINNTNITGNLTLNMKVLSPLGTNFTLGGEYIPLGAALGSVLIEPLTILEVNTKPGTIAFSSPMYSVNEGAGTATITVTRTGADAGTTATVNYSATSGTAIAGKDFKAASGSLTFGPGVTSQTFKISIIDHTVVSPDATVTLNLYNPYSPGAIQPALGQSTAVLTIVNDNFNNGHITFTSPAYSTNENAHYAYVFANRLGGSAGVIQASLVVAGGSAVNGVNYIASTNLLTWDNGDVATKTIAIPVMDDGLVTSNLTVNLSLTNAVLVGQGTNPNLLGLSQFTNAVLTIINLDSAGTVQFNSPVYSVKKYGGYALVPVVRTGGSAQTVTVNYATTNGTAIAGTNYVAVSGTLMFTNGEVGKFIKVPIIDDGVAGGLKAFNVALSGATPAGALGSPSNAVVNIIDTESVNEPPGSTDITYNSLGFNGTVYSLLLQPDNRLLVGGDFTMADAVPRQHLARLYPDGSLDPTFLLPSDTSGADNSVRAIALQADGRILVGGLFTNFDSQTYNHIARLNPDGSLDSLFNNGQYADNAVYALGETFVNGSSKIMVGGAFANMDGTPINGIARLNSDGTLDTAFNPGLGANGTVYALAVQGDGKVVIGGNFTSVNGNTNFNHIARLNPDGSLDASFNPGTGANDSVRAIAVQFDGKILLGGLFTSVNGNTNFCHIARLNMDGSLDSTFTPGLGANDAVYSIVMQNDGRIVLGGAFTRFSGVTRNGITRLNPDGTVDPTINFGTGANNFVAAAVIQQDTVYGYPTNVPDEKIIIGGGFTQYDGQPQPHLARIYGGSMSGVGAFEFSSPAYSVDETGTNALITILRTGGTSGTNADASGDILVPFYTSAGTAVPGANYLEVTNNIDFPEGEVLQQVRVPVLHDFVITPNLTVNLALNPAPPAAFGNQPVATLTIINDDSAIAFSAPAYTVAKNAVNGAAVINIQRLGSASGTSTVQFSTIDTPAGGTSATPGTDYWPTNVLVTFNPGMTNTAVMVPIINNGLPEGNQTVALQLTGVTGSMAASLSNAVLTIFDTVNAPGQLSFSAPSYTVTEGGGAGYITAVINVVRKYGTYGTVFVNYTTADGTALAPAKYLSTNGVIKFADGETNKSFTVQVVNTTTAEGPEYLNLLLANATGGATLAAPSAATLNILNTNIGIAFASPTNSYLETDGAYFNGNSNVVFITVQRLNTTDTNVTTTVDYYTSDGTAQSNVNYTATSGTLVFTNGQVSAVIPVQLLHDTNVTGALQFSLSLANPSPGAQLTAPETTVIQERDAETGLSFLTDAATVQKTDGYAILYVLCSNTNVEPVTVSYLTADGTAAAGKDYTATSGTLLFSGGLSLTNILVPITPNNLQQSNKTFTVTLSGTQLPGVLVPPTRETITIIETNPPAPLSFYSPVVIGGGWGRTNVSNLTSLPDTGMPTLAGYSPNAPVWFKWTAPADGEVTLDTIGSLATNGLKLDTVLGVFTGSSLAQLNQVAANDDLYPNYALRENEMVQNTYSLGVTNTTVSGGITNTVIQLPTSSGGLYAYQQPFWGPSGLRFNAKAGTTYFFVADSKPIYMENEVLTNVVIGGVSYQEYLITESDIGRGNISLNWAYHPSGVFRFATEQVDMTEPYSTLLSSGSGTTVVTTGSGSTILTSGTTLVSSSVANPMLLYQCAESESSERRTGTITVSGLQNDAEGLLVTVTRVAGSTGRMAVDYTTKDGDPTLIRNGDAMAKSGVDYSPASGTLVFDDYEMSKTILIYIYDDYLGSTVSSGTTSSPIGNGGIPQLNRDFEVVLSNPRPDPTESGDVSPPRVDPVFSTAICRILDCDIDPHVGPRQQNMVTTNLTVDPISQLLVTNIATNLVYNLSPSNGVSLFNFDKTDYRVSRYYGTTAASGTNAGAIYIYVNRSGTNTPEVKLHYRIDSYFDEVGDADYDNAYFPLMPGSDYATPPSGPYPQSNVADFTPGPGGATGILDFKDKSYNSQAIQININNNSLTEFNQDLHLSIFEDTGGNNPSYYQCGMVSECNVTILFDDLNPPAGSVDEWWNPDYSDDMWHQQNGSLVAYPGTEAASEVYSLAITPGDQTVIGGAFKTYTDRNNTKEVDGLARLNTDGSLDTSFNTFGGVDVQKGEFIRSLALEPQDNKILIGGKFSTYKGNNVNLARVNTDGSADTTFNVGLGPNGTVWSVVPLTSGQIMIGGDFTSYNGTTRNHIARLNLDGSLDTAFDPGNNFNSTVYAISMIPRVVSISESSAFGQVKPAESDVTFNLLPNMNAGFLTVNYDMHQQTNELMVFYPPTAAAANLIYDTGAITNAGRFTVFFGPGAQTSLLLVMDTTNTALLATNVVLSGTNWNYTATVKSTAGSQAMVGGAFTSVGGTLQNRIARVNTDGTLDTTFAPGSGPDAPVRALAVQSDNRVLVAGEFTHVTGLSAGGIARLMPGGTNDPSFFAGSGLNSIGYSLTVDDNSGLIYVGGSFTRFNGTHRQGFARLNTDGTLDTSFMDTAYNQFAGLTRRRYIDPPGAVFASGLQSDGNIMIAGSFSQVGGGQFDPNIRLQDYNAYDPNLGVYVNETGLGGVWDETETRAGMRNRGNVARLIGGATPGPGNIGLLAPSYGANKTQGFESVTLQRVNGSLGNGLVNFSVQSALAQQGLDYAYNSTAPYYPEGWEVWPSRTHADGMMGENFLMTDGLGRFTAAYGIGGPASVIVNILNNPAISGNTSAQFQLANPGGQDQFYLGGENIPLGLALGESSAPLTIIDNTHQDGVFGFSAPNYTGTNASASVSVLRTNGTIGTVQVSYKTTTSGTALAGADYLPANGVLTFNPGQASNSFPVTILQNSYISSAEKTVGLQLFNIQDTSGGNAALGLTNAVLRIINPNYAGYLNFTANSYSANISSGAMAITVSRTVGSKGSLSVQYATADGTAVNGADYLGSTNTLSWDNGDVSPRSITIPLLNNGLIGPNKQFSASLFNATLNGTNTPSLLGHTTNATLVIVNNNSYGAFQFSASSYIVHENGGYATVTVTRGGSALGTASVNYATADGTALAGTNYAPASGTLTFAPGELSTNFTVQLLDDGKTNGPPSAFYFAVQLSAPSVGASLGAPSQATVNILDAESYNEQPGSPDPSFSAAAAMNDSVLALALQSNGQIVAGGNFMLANGVSVNHLARLNPDGTLDAAFLNGQSGADGPVNALWNQNDDRVLVAGAFANMNQVVRHRLARLMTDGTLDSSFNPGSGADNTVFALATTRDEAGNRLIYAGGAFSLMNNLPRQGIARLLDDGSVDTAFDPGLGAIGGTVYAIAVYPTNAIYNAGKVLLGGTFTNFNGHLVGNLVRLNPDGSVDSTFNANPGANGIVRALALGPDGGVFIGGDFTSVNGVALNHFARLNGDGSVDTAFAANLAGGMNGSVDGIMLQADNRIMVVGNFSQANGVTRNNITRLLQNGSVDPTINFGDGANNTVNAIVIQPADQNLVIGGAFTQYDDQPHARIARIYGGSMTGSGAFSFTAAGFSVAENGVYALIGVHRTGGTSGTNSDGSGSVFVHFATDGGTAVPGLNYLGVTNDLYFPPGEVFKTIPVPVMDDGVITPDLTVNLNLSKPSAGTGLGDQKSAVLTIINADASVSFASLNYSVPKNTPDGVGRIDIIRTGSTAGSCTVNFLTDTNASSATPGVDYWPTNEIVTFNPGDSKVAALVPIINNNIPEGNQTVALLLTSAAGATLASPSNSTLTINDTVNAPGQLMFATNSYTITKSDTTLNLTVRRVSGTAGSVSVHYTTVAGTAIPGVNYISADNTLTIDDGYTSGTIPITIKQNGLVQGPVTFSVVLSNPSSGATLGQPTTAVVTIMEDNVGLSFTVATNIVSEKAGYLTLNVARLYGLSNSITVNYSSADGTARSNVNYGAVGNTLTFNPGQALKTIVVPIIDDTNVTGDVSFTVGLSSPSAPAQLTAPSVATVIVQDADAGFSFTRSSSSVLRTAGSTLITVVCSNPNAEPLSVNYATADGTAIAGQDYAATSGTLLFAGGITTNSFPVTILNSSVMGSRYFTVSLTNPVAPGQIVPPSTQTVTILDAVAGLAFSNATYSVEKSAGSATITVLRTAFTNSTASVSYTATAGTAVPGLNFTPVSGTLTFTNGANSQTFDVPISDTTVVQPDLTVLLQLLNPVNGQLAPPDAAVLTIHDGSGSYVIPAGSTLLSEGGAGAPDGIIEPNETVTIQFAFRDAGGTNVGDLKATLLATNGVTPGGTATQDYGPLAYLGHSVSRPFTFTAHGTNNQQIVATFSLYDGAKSIGMGSFSYIVGMVTNTFSNPATINIIDNAKAAQYPSTITVSGLNGTPLKATVTLSGLTHASPSDLEVLLVAPSQKDTLLMANAGGSGGNAALNNAIIMFNDATNYPVLPQLDPILNGIYRPTQYSPITVFPP
jgi:uncharacterized delta-60 repeat protein